MFLSLVLGGPQTVHNFAPYKGLEGSKNVGFLAGSKNMERLVGPEDWVEK